MAIDIHPPNWYPQNVPHEYGQPNEATIECFSELLPGSRILDVAGGYGRYALPLAKRGGYDVSLLDIDTNDLERASSDAACLAGEFGAITPIHKDILKDDLSDLEPFDAALCAGFIYLAPEEVVRSIFQKIVSITKPGGIVVVEFATDRIRRITNDESTLLAGDDEVQYTYEQGLKLVESMYRVIGGAEIRSRRRVRLNRPYYLRSTVILAKGQVPG